MLSQSSIIEELHQELAQVEITPQVTCDRILTLWAPKTHVKQLLTYLKLKASKPYRMLYDLTAIDERSRQPESPSVNNQAEFNRVPMLDFTLIYHLLSFERNHDIRIKVALSEKQLSTESITDLWSSANWYEREVWDMFGIQFIGHPQLKRILMPGTWQGHPLRKNYPARATEAGVFQLTDEKEANEQAAFQFHPNMKGKEKTRGHKNTLYLNVGPHHPGTHGVLRIILELNGEEILNAHPEIGFHHRGAEKMGERQSWHTYIPYTDRIDYLGGVMNNLPYVLAVEKLAGIQVSDRAKIIRILLAELFRIASHLVWYGTFAQDLGALSPVFYMFTDRERILEIIEAICGARMHPNWFRIGGVAQDLPRGWDTLVKSFLSYLPKRLSEYDQLVMNNKIFKSRTQGIGSYSLNQAIDWGVTGPGLRACGLDWDLRKKRPYSGYDQFEFEVPVAQNGDCFDRALVRVEEMRQSLRIIEQCVKQMPEGPIQANHPAATPPLKKKSLHHIETLITHFLDVTWGPVIPAGEAHIGIEATKGNNGYYLISDGSTHPYRVRIRSPSFPHLQMIPLITRGHWISDLFAILGSIDYVLADVDR